MRQLLSRFIGNAYGATAIEYCLIAGAVALAIIVTVNAVGTSMADLFFQLSTNLTAAP